MTTIGLVVHHQRPEAAALAVEAAGWLAAAGHEVLVPIGDGVAIEGLRPWATVDGDFDDDLQAAVSVGGDGTMLRTARLANRAGIPVLGINVGHLGYLNEVEPALWRPALERLLAGDYEVEERTTLDVALVDVTGATKATATAVNDAVVEKLEAGHTVRVSVSISGRTAIEYAADALIVATPTGSTAYNLSAGGPLVSPSLRALLVTPVAPHSLFGRATVVAPEDVVRVRVLSGSGVLGVDGRRTGGLVAGDVIECRAGRSPARFATFGGRDFWGILTSKLGLGGP